MSKPNEVIAPPASDAAKEALEALRAAGHEIATDPVKEPEGDEFSPEKTEPEKETPKKEETPEDPKRPEDDGGDEGGKGEDDKNDKPNRTPTMIPAWKVEIERKAHAKAIADLTEKIDAATKKPSEITPEKKEELEDDYKALQEKFGVDPEVLKAMESVLTKKLGVKPEALKELDQLKQERIVLEQERVYSADFEKTVLPLVKAEHPDLSDEALATLKTKLKDFAFTEEYAKLPLVKILRAEKESLITPPAPRRKSGESGGSGKSRNEPTVNFDDMDTDTFVSLSDEQKLAFVEYQSKKSGKSWK